MKRYWMQSISCLFTLSLWGLGQEEIFSRFPNEYFIETGSYIGDGIEQALSTGLFSKVHSIELSRTYYHIANKRFKDRQGVVLWQGDSGEMLAPILEQIEAPATFWLDGHFSGGNTAQAEKGGPILRELEQIKKHPIKTHTILIDDMRLMGIEDFTDVTREMIIKALLEINPEYTIEFLDSPSAKEDILAAFIRK